MWIVFGILALAIVIAFIDVPYLLKQRVEKGALDIFDPAPVRNGAKHCGRVASGDPQPNGCVGFYL